MGVVKSVKSDVSVADASTRRRVQETIMQLGPSTAAELAERLHLTAAAIRRHLTGLTDTGLVEAREQRVYGARGRGRPAKVYALTDLGRDSFSQDYDNLAVQALQFVADREGDSAVRAFAAGRVATVEDRYREHLAGDPDAGPAEALAAALTDDGYVASTRPAAAGTQLCQHHCPVSRVAEQFPELCEVETETFARLLGVHVQRLATIAHGDGVCTTHIPHIDPNHQSTPSMNTQGTSTQGTSTPNMSTQSTHASNHEEGRA
ncbi:helix-turn-helix transcriptional regulator [Microlunatus sp. Y2014]|uniref:helix-turn-helix transcriptional regulator n=1 Tax=Microlunatus sp. Y2014 TaxID=3418488 RepID=UPI003DA76964